MWLVAAVWPICPEAAEPEPTRILIQRVRSEPGLDGAEALASSLDAAILEHLGRNKTLETIDEQALKDLARHVDDQLRMERAGGASAKPNVAPREVEANADSKSRISEIMAASDTALALTSRLGRIGAEYLVSLKLVDTRQAKVERADAASGKTPDALVVSIRQALDRLFGETLGGAGRRFELPASSEGMPVKAAVLELESHGVDPVIASSLTEVLSLELRRSGRLDIITRDEVRDMLTIEFEKAVLECRSQTDCLIEIGGALGVDFLVSGSVGRLGDAYVLILKLTDVKQVTVVSRVGESFRGLESNLAMAVRAAARRLVGYPPAAKLGSVRVLSNAGACTLEKAGRRWTSPAGQPILEEVPIGRYQVQCTGEDYMPRALVAFVEPFELTELRVDLEPRPLAWWEEWWTWTLIGSATATVTVGGFLTYRYMTEPPSSGTGVVVLGEP